MNEVKTRYRMPATPVSNELIPAIFPKIRPLLEKNREYWEDYYTLKDIKIALIKGEFQLWVGVEGPDVKLMVITTLVVYPRSVWLRMPFIAGERIRSAIYYLPVIETWARARGAIGIEGYSVSLFAWEKIMKRTVFNDFKSGFAFKMKFKNEDEKRVSP